MDQTAILEKIYFLLQQHISTPSQDKGVLQYKNPAELRAILQLEQKDCAGDWEAVFKWVEQYLAYSVNSNHPGFVNRMWVGANLSSIVGEIIASITNTSSCTYESAPVATLMEKYMMEEVLDLVGFQNGEGQMTTGSSNANMLAMLAARNTCLQGVKEQGLFKQPEIYAFASVDAHYSLVKAANVLGLGTDHLIQVPVNDLGEMDLTILEEYLQQITDQGAKPFFVTGTAGTTVRGAYDPIDGLLQLRERYPFWLHIDGAWGGAVVVDEGLKKRFIPGIERVDSFTWDFHKMLGTALMCNVFLINNKLHTLGNICGGGDDSYIFHNTQDNEVLNPGAVSLQCGRRVDSLKWFLDWKFYGKEGFASRVQHCLKLCQYAEKIVLENDSLELVVPRTSFNICFHYIPVRGDTDTLNLKLREQLYHEGSSLVGYAYHDNRPFLRLLLTNHTLTEADIDTYFSTLVAKGAELENKKTRG